MATDFEYDLSAALPMLRQRGGQHELVTAIERALWVASAHQDLSDAADALELLDLITKGDGHEEFTGAQRSTVAGCLFAQAVILYARATETKPIEREKWFGREKLKGDDRELHLEAMELRNHALAHFGKAADMADGPLVGEALVMRRVTEGVGIAFYSARAQNRSQFARRLMGLVEQVRSLAYEATQVRYKELGTALSAATQRDPDVPVVMRHYRFEPNTFCALPGWINAFEGKPDVGAFTSHGVIEKPNT